jgi:GNAT superfamily N-acetyltransferase
MMADTQPRSPYELAQEAIAKGVSQQEFEKQLKDAGASDIFVSRATDSYVGISTSKKKGQTGSVSASSSGTASTGSTSATTGQRQQQGGDSDARWTDADQQRKRDLVDLNKSLNDLDGIVSTQSKIASGEMISAEGLANAMLRIQEERLGNMDYGAGELNRLRALAAEENKRYQDIQNNYGHLDEEERTQRIILDNSEDVNTRAEALFGSPAFTLDENNKLKVNQSVLSALVAENNANAAQREKEIASLVKEWEGDENWLAAKTSAENFGNSVYGLFNPDVAKLRAEEIALNGEAYDRIVGIEPLFDERGSRLSTTEIYFTDKIYDAAGNLVSKDKAVSIANDMAVKGVLENSVQLGAVLATSFAGGGAGLLLTRGGTAAVRGAAVARGVSIGSNLGAGTLAVSSAGQDWMETFGNPEMSWAERATSATIKGAAEYFAEKIFVGPEMRALGVVTENAIEGGIRGSLKKVFAGEVSQKLYKAGMTFVKGFGEEAIEEGVTDIVGQMADNIIQGKQYDFFQTLDSMLIGGLSGAGMSTVSSTRYLLSAGASAIGWKDLMANSSINLVATKKQLTEELLSATDPQQVATINQAIDEIDMKIESNRQKRAEFYNRFSDADAEAALSLAGKMRDTVSKIADLKNRLESTGLASVRIQLSEAVNQFKTLETSWNEIHNRYDNQTEQQVQGDVQTGQVSGTVPQQESSAPQTETSGVVQTKEDTELNFGDRQSLNMQSAEEVDSQLEVAADEKTKGILTAVRNSIESLKSIGKEANITLHKSVKSMAEAVGASVDAVKNTRGIFKSKDGAVHIYMPLAKNNTTYHEVLHHASEGTTTAFKQRFVDMVMAGLQSNEVLARKYGRFIQPYLDGKFGKDEITDELYTEIMSDIAAGNVEMNFVKAGMIREIINNIKEKLGIDVQSISDEDLSGILKSMATGLGKGEDISESYNRLVDAGYITSEEIAAEQVSSRKNENQTSEDTQSTIRYSLASHEEVLSRDFKVMSWEQLLKDFGGRFMFINSDPTGYKSTTINGVLRYLMGGIGYTFAKKNVDDGVGFASTQISKVLPALFAAYTIGKGKNVPALVVTNSMKSLLGNYYSMAYALDAIRNTAKNKGFTAAEYKGVITSIIDAMDALTQKNQKTGKVTKVFNTEQLNSIKDRFMSINFNKVDDSILALEKEIEENPNLYSFIFRNEFVNRLLSSSLKGGMKNAGFSKNSLYENLSEEFLMDSMRAIHEKGFLGNLLNKDGSPNASFFEKNGGLVQTGFVLDFETDGSVNNQMAKLFEEHKDKEWSKIPKKQKDAIFAKYEQLTSPKGIKHPQFNAKFMGTSPFILESSIYLNQTYEDHPVLKESIKTQTGKTPNNFKNVAGLSGGVAQSIYFFSEGFDTKDITDETFSSSKVTKTEALIEMFDRYSVAVEQQEDGSLKFQKVSPTFIFEGSREYRDAWDFIANPGRKIRFKGEPLASVYVNGKVAGLVTKEVTQDGETARYAFDIEVVEEHQGKGIASALIKEVLSDYVQESSIYEDAMDMDMEWDVYIVSDIMERLLREKFDFVTKPMGSESWTATSRNTNIKFQQGGKMSELVTMIKLGMKKEAIVEMLMQFDNMLREDAEYMYEKALAAKLKRPIPIETEAEYTRKKAWHYKYADPKAQEIISNSVDLVERFANGELTAVQLREMFTKMLMFATNNKAKAAQIKTLWQTLTRGLQYDKMNEATKRNFVVNVANTFAFMAEEINNNSNNPIAKHIRNIDKAKSLQSKLKGKRRSLKNSKIPFLFTYAEFIDKFASINVMYLSPKTLEQFVDDLTITDVATEKARYKRVKATEVDANGKERSYYTYEIAQASYSDSRIDQYMADARKGKYYLQDRYNVYVQEETNNKQFEMFQEAQELAKKEGIALGDAFDRIFFKAKAKAMTSPATKRLQDVAKKEGYDLTTLEGYLAALDEIAATQENALEEKRQGMIENIARTFQAFQPRIIGNEYFSQIFGVSWQDVSQPYMETWHGTEQVKARVLNRLNKLSSFQLAALEFAMNDYMVSGSQAKLAEIKARITAHIDGQARLDAMGVKASSPSTMKEVGKVIRKFYNKHSLMRKFFRNYDTAKIGKILDVLGVNKIEMAISAADMAYNGVKTNLDNLINRIKEESGVDFNTTKWNAVAQMYTVLKQIPEGMDEMQWFAMVYKAFEKSLAFYDSSKYDSHQYSGKQLAELQEAFDFVFKSKVDYVVDGDNQYQKVLVHVGSHKLSSVRTYVETVSRQHEQFTEALRRYSEVVLGRTFKSNKNYTPFRFIKKGRNQDLLAVMNGSDVISKVVREVGLSQVDREPGAIYDRQDYAFMTSDLIADFNFKGINLNTFKEVLTATKLGENVAYVDQITKEPAVGESNAFSRLMPEAEMRKHFRRAWISYMVDSMSKRDEFVPVKGGLKTSLNFLRDVAAIKFFGSVIAQVIKQSPVLFASMSKMSPQAMAITMRYVGKMGVGTGEYIAGKTDEQLNIDGDSIRLLKASSVFLRDVDEGFFNPMGVDYDSKISENKFVKFFEKGKNASLFTLRQTDKIVAAASWLGFYHDYLVKNGVVDSHDDIDVATEARNPNQDAVIYASMMVTRDHNQSTRRDMAEGWKVLKGGYTNQFISGMIIPFATFSINKKLNMITDIQQIVGKETEASAKKEAAKSVAGNMVELAVFAYLSQLILPALYSMIADVFGGEDDEEKGKLDRLREGLFLKRLVTDSNPILPPLPILEDGYVSILNAAGYAMDEYLKDGTWKFGDEDFEDGLARWKALHGIPVFDGTKNESMFTRLFGVYGQAAADLKSTIANSSSLARESKYTSSTGKEYYIRDKDLSKVQAGNLIQVIANSAALTGWGSQEVGGIAKALTKEGKSRSINEYEKISEGILSGDVDRMTDKIETLIGARNLSQLMTMNYQIEKGTEKFIVEDVIKSMPSGGMFIKDLRSLEKIEDSGRGMAIILRELVKEYPQDQRQQLINAAVVYIGAKSESKAGWMIDAMNYLEEEGY